MGGYNKLDSETDEEKREGITEFLAEATDENLDGLVDKIIKQWRVSKSERDAAAEATAAEALAKAHRAEEVKLEALRKAAEAETAAAGRSAANDAPKTELSEEQQRIKQELLRRYDECAESDEEANGEGESAATSGGSVPTKALSRKAEKKARKEMSAMDMAMNHVNTNKTGRADAQRATREMNKMAHKAQIEKNKYASSLPHLPHQIHPS